MSFGFKKKLYSTNKKNATITQSNNINNNNNFIYGTKEKEVDQQTATIIANHGAVKQDNHSLMMTGDDNGNMGNISVIFFSRFNLDNFT